MFCRRFAQKWQFLVLFQWHLSIFGRPKLHKLLNINRFDGQIVSLRFRYIAFGVAVVSLPQGVVVVVQIDDRIGAHFAKNVGIIQVEIVTQIGNFRQKRFDDFGRYRLRRKDAKLLCPSRLNDIFHTKFSLYGERHHKRIVVADECLPLRRNGVQKPRASIRQTVGTCGNRRLPTGAVDMAICEMNNFRNTLIYSKFNIRLSSG